MKFWCCQDWLTHFSQGHHGLYCYILIFHACGFSAFIVGIMGLAVLAMLLR